MVIPSLQTAAQPACNQTTPAARFLPLLAPDGHLEAENSSSNASTGSITIMSGGAITIDFDSTVDVSAPAGGSAGFVNITTAGSSQPLEIDGIVNADSATGPGAITLTGESNGLGSAPLNIPGYVHAIATGSGPGGTILLQEKVSSLLDEISITGTVSADGTTGGGSITAKTTNAATNPLFVDGPDSTISATSGNVVIDSSTGGVKLAFDILHGALEAQGTSVTIGGAASSETTLEVKDLMASVGDILVTGSNTDFNVDDSGQTGGAIVATGNISITALSFTLSDGTSPTTDYMQANGNVTLSAQNDIQIGSNINDQSGSGTTSITTTGTGNIFANGGAVVSANTLEMQTNGGTITGGSGVFPTAVGTLSANTPTGGGSVAISNTDTGSGLALEDNQTAGGSYSVTTTGKLTVHTVTAGTNVSLQGGSASSNNLVFDSNLTAQNGGISLTASNQIVSNASETVSATGGSITLNTGTGPYNQCPDDGSNMTLGCRVNTYSDNSWTTGGQIIWPMSSGYLTVGGNPHGTFFVNVESTIGNVIFNAVAAGGIQLNGGETFNASN